MLSELAERQARLGQGSASGGGAVNGSSSHAQRSRYTKQIHAQQRDQIRERPAEARLQLQVLQQQQARSAPSRSGSARRWREVPDERLDPQVLLQRLEEQLDLPAVLVDARDGRGPERQMIGQEDQRLARRACDTTTRRRAVADISRRLRGPASESIWSRTTPPVLRDRRGARPTRVRGVALQPRHEDTPAAAVSSANQAIVDVAPVEHQDRARREASAAAPPARRAACPR